MARYLYNMVSIVIAGILLAACGNEETPSAGGPAEYLTISVYSPQPKSETRTHDAVEADNAENRIHDIRVWAFMSGGDDESTPLSYCEKNGIDASYVNLQMPVEKTVIDKILASSGDVVFYVAANTSRVASLSLPSAQATRREVSGLVFGHIGHVDDFGGSTAGNAGKWNVAANGLPCSRAVTKNVVKTNAGVKELSKNLISMQLLRAVSRYRFVFSRATGLHDVEIKKIEVFNEGSGIYRQEKLFSEDEEAIALVTGDAEDWKMDYDLSGKLIHECDNLDGMKKTASETSQQYETRINAAIAAGKATEYARTYIRETNEPLKAVVTYRCEQTEKTMTVSLGHSTETVAGQLPRNHTWLVYGYFDKGRLELTATVQPWDYYDDSINYEDAAAVLDGNQLKWTAGTFDGNDIYQGSALVQHEHSFVAGNDGDYLSMEGTFTFDSPRPATWYASLIHQQGIENAIVFVTTDENGNTAYSTTVSGPVGKECKIYVRPRDNKTKVLNRVRLRFSIKRDLNQQIVNVQDNIIGDVPYFFSQEKNDF